jgi:proteasome alpha subunit
MIYDEPVDVETVAKHLADQCQQFTQFGGARPFGVALIIGGVDSHNALFLTDPSGTYIAYDAVAIGAGSEQANDFLEKNYKPEMSLEDASALATACIYLTSDQKEETDHIKMSHIKTATKQFEKVNQEQIANFAKIGKQKFPIPNT